MSDGLCVTMGYVLYIGWLTHSPNTEVLGAFMPKTIVHDDDKGNTKELSHTNNHKGWERAGKVGSVRE